MAYLDANGVSHGADNSFPTLLGRIFSSLSGWLRVLIPLAVGVIIFFLIKKYAKNGVWLIVYTIIAVLIYLFYFFIILSKYYMYA